jgi:dye decolorizing peroxidase
MADEATPALSRRRLLVGGALAVGGASLAGAGVGGGMAAREPASAAAPELGRPTEPFFGVHQAGVATRAQAHASFVAFDLAPGTDRAALVRLMRLLTDDAARLCEGRAPLADTEPDLVDRPARLSVTMGFGPGVFAAAGLDGERPRSLAPLPAFGIDRLEERWSGGDLVLQVCADDPLTVGHARRMLIKDARPFGTVRWTQSGFRRAEGVHAHTDTQRNVMGQLDGTVNPVPGTAAFDRAVWVDDGPQWWHGGTSMVIRRIRAEMETWDAVDRHGKEFTVGRRLDTGAPLTGRAEHDEPDLAAVDSIGLPVIDTNAHIRRARADREELRILRRPYNYDGQPGPTGIPDAGLIFVAYQADIARQFIPVQQRLAEADLLNQWTTPIGSAVFAIPPGCQPGGWIGETLLG